MAGVPNNSILNETSSADQQSRHSAMAILAALADQHAPVTVAELAAVTALHRASLYRNIEGLADEGLVERIAGTPRRYSIGLEFIRIGLRSLRHFELRTLLLPSLVELAIETGEPCSLLFYDRGEAVGTDSVYLPEPPIVTVAEGVRIPVHCHGMGKAMLALQSEAEIARVLSRPLRRYTSLTIVAPDDLRSVLVETRERGYGFAFGELHDGLGTVGFPLRNRQGVAVASLGVRVLRPEGPTDVILAIGRAVSAKASSALGYRPGPLGAL